MKTGAQLIQEERERQISAEGWTPEHDAEHENGDMISAAIGYLIFAWWKIVGKACGWTRSMVDQIIGEQWWPWDSTWWKPSEEDQIRNLVKAGALIAAEVDRLQREAWIGEVAQCLAEKHGDKEPNENLKIWARSHAVNFYDESPGDYTPKEAVDEELSNF